MDHREVSKIPCSNDRCNLDAPAARWPAEED